MSEEDARKIDRVFTRLARQWMRIASQMECGRLELVELSAELDENDRPEVEIAECAIARARMRGID